MAKDTPKGTDKAATGAIEEALRPFQEASAKFLQASVAAHEAAIKQRAQAWLDLQDEARKIEQDTHHAVLDATRKHLEKLGQPATASPEDAFAARAQSQIDYEKAVRQAHVDAQTKLTTIAQKASGESTGGGGGDDSLKKLTNQRQDAYQTYLADLQKAWSGVKSLDPQTVNAIASNILFTINAIGQAG